MMGNTIYDDLYQAVQGRVKHSVWVVSDLQQGDPQNVERCLSVLADDYERMGRPAEQIWYLGDSVEGIDRDHLEKMTKLQMDCFSSYKIPLCYVTGNHDYDYSSYYLRQNNPEQRPIMPFYEAVQQKEEWHTTAHMEDFWFKTMLGDYPVYFFSDHISEQNRWLVTHGGFRYGEEYYPYTQKDMDAVRELIQSEEHEVITASHYSYFGGNRESKLLSTLLPLPQNIKLHLYGHSHIGDFKWGGKNVFRRVAWTDFEDVPQVDVSSMENIRGPYCRSVLLQIYNDGTMGLFFRNHDAHQFNEAFFPSKDKLPSVSMEKREEILCAGNT